MIKAIPETALPYVLKVFNLALDTTHTSFFHDNWRVATIIPMPTPGKDHSDPRNYRPMPLTSCLCKILEKKINCRLVEYMENNKIFSEIQCGFRRYKSTLDHLVRMDTFVRKDFAGEEKTIPIIFIVFRRLMTRCGGIALCRTFMKLV